MLQIPEEIKELLHQDHCEKNIRIHFPNGERSDICNNLIVKDSVSFTESLCSQSTLKFGLCESPIFECEVVGVGNIKGAKIEVFCEIHCSSTVEGAVFRFDLGYHVYPIPYGTFVVDSSKRQADMIHRKIVAYNSIATRKWEICEAEKLKQIYQAAYTPNIGYFLATNGINLINSYTTEELYTRWSSQNISMERYSISESGCYVLIELYGIELSFYNANPQYDFDALYRVEATQLLNQEQLQSEVASFFLNTEGPQAETIKRLFRGVIDEINKCVADAYNRVARQRIGTDPWTESSINSIEYYYPYLGDYYTSITGARYRYLIPYYIDIRKKQYSGTEEAHRIDIIDYSSFKAYKRKITTSNAVTDLRFTIPTNYPQGHDIDYSNFSDIQSLANSFAELLGVFGYYERTGDMKNIDIKRQFGLDPNLDLYPGATLYPQGVTGGTIYTTDYQSCWYDDEYTKPFGAITCQYKNTDNEDCLFTLYLTGYDADSDTSSYQVYSLDNNEIIKGTLWTEAQIQDICNIIADNIDGVSYMAVDFVGRGLPYVEAGDTFEILTKRNDSITTIVLNRTITGEMTLTDSYKSV